MFVKKNGGHIGFAQSLFYFLDDGGDIGFESGHHFPIDNAIEIKIIISRVPQDDSVALNQGRKGAFKMS